MSVSADSVVAPSEARDVFKADMVPSLAQISQDWFQLC